MNYLFWILLLAAFGIAFMAYSSNKKAQKDYLSKKGSPRLKHLTDESFKTTILDGIVLVDFWAPWCAPCRTMDPVINEIADEMGDKITVCKINLDEHKQAARDMKIKNIPNIIIFKNGEPKMQIIGAKPKYRIVTALNEVLEEK